jgi:cell division initiation protein
MERMSQIDIDRSSTHLRTTFRGYDRAQVLEVLQKAALEMSALRGDVDVLKTQLDRQSLELETFRSRENAIKEAIIQAQHSAEETRLAAQREADAILEGARSKGAEIEQQARDRMNDLRWELERLRLERQKFIHGFRSMLEAQLRDLTEANGLAVVEGANLADASQA